MINGVAHSSTGILEIPEGVTSISHNAFKFFSNVRRIKIPSSVKDIPSSNFANHTYIYEIFIYNNGTIGNGAFANCTALIRVHIGEGVKGFAYASSSSSYPFYGCSKLATVNARDLKAFCAMTNLEYLTNSSYGTAETKRLSVKGTVLSESLVLNIPEDITYIPNAAFRYFWNVTRIKTPESMETINSSTFYGHNYLKEIILPSTVTSVGSSAFSSCTNLERVVCWATTCPSVTSSIATDPGNVILKVPAGTGSLYKSANVWKDFNVAEGQVNTTNWTLLTRQTRIMNIDSDARIKDWVVSNPSVVNANGNQVTANDFTYDGTTGIPYKTTTITAIMDNCDQYVWNIKINPREVTLTDGNAYKNTVDFETEKISYTRTFNATAGKWQCLYVPFDIEVTDELLEDFDFAELYMVSYHDANNNGEIEDNEPLRMTFSRIYAGKTLHANMPYYIRSKSSGKKTIEVTNTTLKAAANGSVNCSTTKHEYTLVGIYNTTNINGRYTMASDGTFSYYTKDTNLKANRWYMEVTSRTGSGADLENYARPIEIVVEGDEETTGILTIDADASSSQNDKIYTLDGRQVTDYDTLPSGIYIVNGKKVYKK